MPATVPRSTAQPRHRFTIAATLGIAASALLLLAVGCGPKTPAPEAAGDTAPVAAAADLAPAAPAPAPAPAAKALPPVNVDAAQLAALIDSYKGKKAVLVNMWATWCAPCVEEFPEIVAIQKQHPDDLAVIFVSCDFPDGMDDVIDFLTAQGVTAQTYFKSDDSQDFFGALHPKWEGTLPATLIRDRNGKEVTFFINKADAATFEAHVAKALAAAE